MMQRNDGLRFCHLEARHIDQLAEMEQLCFSDPWSRESLAEELTNPLSVYYICEAGDRVLGYIGTRMILDECEIVNVAVRPEERRKHIASMLLEWLLEDVRARKIVRIDLEVRESNLPAQKCYEAAGFTPVGRRKNYYESPKEDALLMAREIAYE